MRKIYYLKVLFFALIISCVDRYVVPNDIASQNNSQFGAGDTTYLQIKPVWDAAYGIEQPEDISIAQDGRVFVADRGNNSILVFDQNGERPEGYNRLTNIQDGDCIVGIRPEDIILSNEPSENSIEVEFRTKTPLNLRIVFLVRLENGLEFLCSTTEEESQLIDENKKMYISFLDEKSHFFDKETKRNLE